MKTFSDSWHQVAGVKAALRPDVKVRRQWYRGQQWHVIQDPFNNKFFRLRPEAWDFIARLRRDSTIETIWQETLNENPESAPGQEEVVQLLTQLHTSNLLYYDTASDCAPIYERFRKQRNDEIRNYLASIMFARIPLFDPDRFLQRLLPVSRHFMGMGGLLSWLIVVVLAAKVAVEHWADITQNSQSVLAPDNLILLYVGVVIIKIMHEFGHAVICRHFGGEVHTMGAILIVFTPMPYMDATSSWAFRNRWHRALVGGGGMIVEIFIAALAVFVWVNTGEGVIHSLAWNMIFVASVSTILFNANPLLNFDGYYILSDIIDVPNLYGRAQQQLRWFVERGLFNVRHAESPAQGFWNIFGLTSYGLAAGLYKIVVFVGIILFIGDQYLILGFLMAVYMTFMWTVKPFYKLLKYLFNNEKIARKRSRAMWLTAVLTGLTLTALLSIPMADRFRAPGIIQSKHIIQLSNDSEGYLTEILIPPGQLVTKGSHLLKLSNPELLFEVQVSEAQLQQVSYQLRLVRNTSSVDLQPLEKRKKSLSERLQTLREREKNLIVTADKTGLWTAPLLETQLNTWLARGSSLGQIIDPDERQFIAVVAQDAASDLFNQSLGEADIRLYAQPEKRLTISDYEIIPYQQQILPSAALGWHGGGSIAVDPKDPDGLKTIEPFFRINVQLPAHAAANLKCGQRGEIRFNRGQTPLFFQWERNLRQILQRRYQL